MKAKALNIKNMKETIVNYSGNNEDFIKIWNDFYNMVCLGFISRETWVKFYDQCKDWEIDEERAVLTDGIEDIYDYASGKLYRA